MNAIDRIIAEISSYSHQMIKTSDDFRNFFNHSIHQFKEKTADHSKYSTLQGWTTIGVAVVGAGCGAVGAFGPATVKSVCEVGGKFVELGSRAVDPLFRSPLTELEAGREIKRNNYQKEAEERSLYSQATEKAQRAVMDILQAKARGG